MQVNITVRNEADIPDFIQRLKAAKFYGSVTFTFRGGHMSRLITEESVIFDEPKGGTHDRNNR